MKAVLNFAGELFAFLVVAAVIYRYVVPPLRKAMAARQDMIRAEFDEARDAKEQAEAAEQKFRASISDVEAEVAEIRESAERLAQQIVEDLKAKAQDEADRIGERGQQQLAADREALIRGIRAEMGILVVELAGRIVVDALADEARRAATIDRFLAELDALAPANAGRA
ncbi:MAG: ATP synthase F0 subunit B [Pseudonocardiales bacterium]|nr:MAG: ATP synthase F0 subunit B [Pseudonocardiales bacterium]